MMTVLGKLVLMGVCPLCLGILRCLGSTIAFLEWVSSLLGAGDMLRAIMVL